MNNSYLFSHWVQISFAAILVSLSLGCADDQASDEMTTPNEVRDQSSRQSRDRLAPEDSQTPIEQATDLRDQGEDDAELIDESGGQQAVPAMDTNDEVDDLNEGESGRGECSWTGPVGIKLVAQVSWPGGLAMEPGRGEIEIWFSGQAEDGAQGLTTEGRICHVTVPDFHTTEVAGGDTHGTLIPSTAWTRSPTLTLSFQLDSSAENNVFRSNPTAVLLGSEMREPMGAWPDSGRQLTHVDHDQDGHPGVTTHTVEGAEYSQPRIALLDPNLRAQQIFIGLRTILGFDGSISGCGQAVGRADVIVDQRVFGCLTTTGDACNRRQTSLLDSNMPQFVIEQARFEYKTLDAGGGCDAVLTNLP
tara:strand:- start:217 stop:1299 length:1083 start_codon:yes stop_codon:yes gene_type:complete